MTDCYWISLSYATYGVIVRDGIVVEAAPIAHWMIGKHWSYCSRWVIRKGGEVRRVRLPT